jgi:hypothetical protein
LKRIITLISIATLAVAVLGGSFPDHRLPISIIVSAGGILLAVQAFSARKPIFAFLFLGVLGVFTPFQIAQFSHSLVPILDMATLALFAISPFMFRTSVNPMAVASLPGSAATAGARHQIYRS